MKLKTKIISLVFASALFVGGALGAGLAYNSANAEEWTSTTAEWQWEEKYELGSTFTVPSYEVTVGDETVGAISIVTLPDGSTTTKTSLNLTQAGIYTVSYYASKGGKEYSKSVQFEVSYKAYYVTGSGSSVAYGVYTDYEADSPEYSSYKHDGLLVKLANGDKLEFTHLIDTTALTSSDNLITGFVTPLSFGVADFDKLTFVLTDAENPDIYLQMDINRWTKGSGAGGAGKANGFVSAGGNGQDLVGYENGKGLHVNDNVGTPLATTFVAAHYKNANGSLGAYWSGIEVVQVAPSRYPFSLSYDAGLNAVFTASNLVADLDNADYYSNFWSGFPSGKARMSVSASGYQGVTANFCLTGVYGLEGLNSDAFAEEVPPVITVNTEYEKLPAAKVGTAYKVPTATAYDEYSGVCEVETKVWYNYASDKPVSVTVKDGVFVPTRNGYYSIVYTAKDVFGNTATEAHSFFAMTEIPALTVENPANVPTTATLGYPVAVEAPTYAGGTGNISYTVTATDPDGKSYVLTDSFIPDVAGTWTVTYTVADYIDTQASCSFDVEATAGDKPVIDATLVLPKVYLNGVSYNLPMLYADDYSTGRKVSVPCDVKIEYADKTETKKAGEAFVPSVSENGEKIKITYYSGNASLETVEIPVVIVRSGNDVYVKNYIYGENVEVSDKDENGKNFKGLQIMAKEAGEAEWTFANPQVAELFSVKLSSIKNKTMYKGMKINLTDVENPEQSATLYIAINSGNVTVTNGSFSADIDVSFSVESIFTISYAEGKFKFDNVNIAIDAYDNGEEFKGFTSNNVYASVCITEAAKGSAYMLLEVSGSATTFRNKDFTAPSFAILGDFGGSYSLGDSYTLAPAIAGDTFAPQTSLMVSVYDAEGNVISDKNGLPLENVDASKAYSITLSNYGLYSIEYVASEIEWLGNTNEFTNYIYVMDEEAPVITITSEYTRTAKVGDIIVLPTFTVTDNLTEEAKIVIDRFVQNPTGRLVRIPYVSNSVVASYEGTYFFRIMAKDEYGNVATVTLEVIVTK